ncbi:MAG: c-type cytochrome [Lunatimonas sp.]|uniref:PVC-type heme-binding CxxCH protein n=1 Tax=Lunatimonas sp. TaxID=2060141 RepID=UPI00263AC2EE|nr:PVC-type heme-binding CxxCH protein [Lunatimonas sp.]MCC5938930.1 c-type cytochrome [Lunatimonas sp.]
MTLPAFRPLSQRFSLFSLQIRCTAWMGVCTWRSFSLVVWVLAISCKGADRADPLPSQSIRSFELMEGFQIELIASEPLVADPVDMEIDEYGRMYVVEMHGYPLDVTGTGKVKLLEDTNGDGIMDKSTVFADSLILPTGIMRWKQGVLVTDPPHVWYLEDTDGDGRADRKEVLLTGFARSNPQHNVNSPRLAMDNWIYLGHEPAVTTNLFEELFGDGGSEVHFPADAEGIRLPVNAGGRGVRFKPDAYGLELLSSRTQFGHTWDAYGNRFLVNNNNHVIHEVMRAEYLGRNPYFPVANTTHSVSDHGHAAEVYAITDDPEHQLLTDVGVFTSACGPMVYLGGAFPDEFEGMFFVNEPVSNLIHADRLAAKGATFAASRLLEKEEFLASRDAWFRPVNLYVGPDGALYVVDYYRQIIEHPEWMADEVVNSGALYNGTDQGRIYRITPTGTGKMDWSGRIALGDASTQELVSYLDHSNVWWRKHAQRLLIDRSDRESLPKLQGLARDDSRKLGRLHALWTLEGMGALTEDLIQSALASAHAGLRVNAVRLAETYLPQSAELTERLLTLSADADPKVRFQLLNTLGMVEGQAVAETRQQLLNKDLSDEWVQVAALSAAPDQVRTMLPSILGAFGAGTLERASLVRKLGRIAGMEGEKVADLVDQAIAQPAKPWQGPLLAGLNEGLRGRLASISFSDRQLVALKEALFVHPDVTVKTALVQLVEALGSSRIGLDAEEQARAKVLATDRTRSGEERAVYVRLMGLRPDPGFDEMQWTWIGGVEPLPVQVAALRQLAHSQAGVFQDQLFTRWATLSPELREASLSILMGSREYIAGLLEALDQGVVHPSHLGWPRTVQLMNQKDLALKARAREILTRHEKEREEVLAQYAEALTLEGSALAGTKVYEANCAVCHQMGKDRGQVFGPDLASLRNRRLENILSDILDPNLSIADGYDLWSIEMRDGEVVQGLIASETPTALSIRQAGGVERTLAREEIRQIQTLGVSAMPAGLEAGISKQEMADLLAFIKGG